jgi:glycosyltransferase involved in cell wall biosynthesis
MRILVVSNLFPPVARGGYEVECSAVVERLRGSHDVIVLASSAERSRASADARVWRELPLLTPDRRGALRAPFAAVRSVRAARHVLSWSPDFVYVWNGSSIGQSALRVLGDSGVPVAFRICEHWFAHLFADDQFLRELLPARRGPARAAWAAGCRTINRLSSMRLDALAPMRAAISWNSETLHRMVPVPSSIEPVLERVGHSVPAHGDLYAAVVRDPAPEPELLFVGRVTPYKGISVAIEALARLRSEHAIAAKLVVVGPEDRGYAASMRELAVRLGVGQEVLWRGQAPPQEVARAMARAHALIMPSVWEEPFPLVTIEAALAHVPLVASDVGGVSEGMQDGEHALLFPRGDAAMAAAALARTLREPGPTAARVQRARERAGAFRIGPYLDEQERFVADAYAILRHGEPASARREPRNAPTPAI